MEDVGEGDEGDDEEWGGVCWDEEKGEPAIHSLLVLLCDVHPGDRSQEQRSYEDRLTSLDRTWRVVDVDDEMNVYSVQVNGSRGEGMAVRQTGHNANSQRQKGSRPGDPNLLYSTLATIPPFRSLLEVIAVLQVVWQTTKADTTCPATFTSHAPPYPHRA